MGIKLYKGPQLKDSIMFCGWPGIGNIGLADHILPQIELIVT